MVEYYYISVGSISVCVCTPSGAGSHSRCLLQRQVQWDFSVLILYKIQGATLLATASATVEFERLHMLIGYCGTLWLFIRSFR